MTWYPLVKPLWAFESHLLEVEMKVRPTQSLGKKREEEHIRSQSMFQQFRRLMPFIESPRARNRWSGPKGIT